jgi:pimeloyl-ACP methyl ester carboxylesterase
MLPAELLGPAYLVGKIPFRICQLDSRVSYTLYIPADAYRKVHKQLEKATKQESIAKLERLRLIVNIHGTRRDAGLARDSLTPLADRHGVAILSPLFPAGLDGPLDLDSYKKLRTKSLKTDLVLLDILKEVATIWPGIDTEEFTLAGFSGGAQFAHRFMYLYPERLEAVALGAPGSTTLLDNRLPWPAGIADVTKVFDGQTADVAAISRIKHILLYVGGDDTATDQFAQLQELMARHLPTSQSASLKARVGRAEGTKALWVNWEAHGVRAQLEVVPGIAHDYSALLPTLESWLKEHSTIGD